MLKNAFYKAFLLLTLSLVTVYSYPQPKEIDITFLGNCGFFLTDGKINLYIDFPYKSGAYNYMTYDQELLDSIHADAIFLYSHGHADHYNKKLFKKTNQKLYAPWPVTLYLSGKRKYQLKELNDSLPDFHLVEYKTKHRFSFKNCSYVIEWDGKRIFISGDAETADTLCAMKNLDLVIAPYWVIMDASTRNLKIDTRKIIICHHRTRDQITTKDEKIIIPLQNQQVELR